MNNKDENFEIPKEFLGHKRSSDECISNECSHMLTAMSQALISRDPSTQVGACFVNNNEKVISVGYNSPPNGWSDDEFVWDKPDIEECNKYTYIVHAEMNGLLNYDGSVKDFKGSTLYVTFIPCPNCAKNIIQAGIKKVVYLADSNPLLSSTIATKFMFRKCNIEYVKFSNENLEKLKTVLLDLESEDSRNFSVINKESKKDIKTKRLNLKKDNK